MIKTEIAASAKALISTFCLYVLSLDAEFAMSVVAFIVILVSNFSRFKAQIKLWFRKLFKK